MLVGIIDPSHSERQKDKWGRYPAWTSVDDLLKQAEVASPKWSNWLYELMAVVIGAHQERDYLSVTALTGGCMRSNILERKEDYIASLDGAYAALRGTMVHRTLELAARQGSLAEWRFWTTVDGQEISCSPDLVTYDSIVDWKTTENPPTFGYMWNGHKLQLQFNRFIFNHAEKWEDAEGVPDRTDIPLDPHHTRIQHLVIEYLGPKGPKLIETQKTQKGQNGGRSYKVPDVWTDDEVLAELRPRMEAWQLAMDAYPAWPDGLETYPGWDGPPGWKCIGPPLCYLPNCLGKRYPDGLVWPSS